MGMSGQEVLGDVAELSDRRMSFTEIGIAVAFLWMLMPQALRLIQLV
jgi:hypothetical protein